MKKKYKYKTSFRAKSRKGIIMKNYELKISQFVDNELSANEQQELFRFLSESEEARQTLIDFMEMKKETKSFYAGMNLELNDSKIVTAGVSAQNERGKKYKSMFYFSAAASIIFAFLFLANQFKENPILAKYQNLQTEMVTLQENYSDILSKQIELVRVNDQLYEETEKLKTAQVVINNKSDKKTPSVEQPKVEKQQKKPNYKNRNNYLASIPTYTITKDDFLGQQIIGN